MRRSYILAAIVFLVVLAAIGIVAVGAGETGLAGRPVPWQLGLQPGVTPLMDLMEDFHNLLLFIIVAISLFVLALMLYVMVRFNARRNPVPTRTSHNTLIEIAWTVVPVLILLVVAVPSFRLLYYVDRVEEPELTLQVTGYQWYWGYEYPDQQIGEFSAYLVPEEELEPDQVRLLSTDVPVVLPVDTNIQILITAGDVLHAWAVQSFGIKQDAVPGRMNEIWARIEEEGIYYGQCSEICGTGHAYMPIEIHAVSREEFDDWVVEQTAAVDPENPPKLLTMTWEEAMAKRQLALNTPRQ